MSIGTCGMFQPISDVQALVHVPSYALIALVPSFIHAAQKRWMAPGPETHRSDGPRMYRGNQSAISCSKITLPLASLLRIFCSHYL